MTTANIAEVLKLSAKPVQYNNDEQTWLEFRFKLENFLTLVVRSTWRFCKTQSLKQWRTFQQEQKDLQ